MTDKLHGKNLRIWIFALLGGIVFAAFDRCGYMIQHYGTLWAISENPLHKTIFHRILIRVPLFTAGVLISFLLLNWSGAQILVLVCRRENRRAAQRHRLPWQSLWHYAVQHRTSLPS